MGEGEGLLEVRRVGQVKVLYCMTDQKVEINCIA
jgi:hypothetical protein